jgi:hypothetical protein
MESKSPGSKHKKTRTCSKKQSSEAIRAHLTLHANDADVRQPGKERKQANKNLSAHKHIIEQGRSKKDHTSHVASQTMNNQADDPASIKKRKKSENRRGGWNRQLLVKVTLS